MHCPLAKKCSGCQLQNMDYEEQLGFKQAKLVKLLGRYGYVEEIIGMNDPLHYRNKVQAAFGFRRGRIISGVYQSAKSSIVPVDNCLLEDEKADAIVVTIRKLCESFKIRAYDSRTGNGFLRHVLIRTAKNGAVMVVLVTAKGDIKSKTSFVNALIKRHPEIKTVVRNINNTDKGLMLGDHSEVYYGDGYITDTVCDLHFRISPKSFFQVNRVQTEVLYNKAVEFAHLTGKERVLDAYCGTGTIGLIMARRAKEVFGVEANRDAVRDAVVNAEINGIKNIRFFAVDAGHFMDGIAAEGETMDVVVTDPPRAGCSPKFLKSLIALGPKRIVYVSCNPETLARDLYTLKNGGYAVKKMQPVDMFPYTAHVETIVLLGRKDIHERIKFDVNVEDLHGRASATATYPEIKAYVLEKFGLKVSSLYIAQIKEKCGLDKRENFNIGEGKSRPLICPPEKEQAIMDAFRHFGMIDT